MTHHDVGWEEELQEQFSLLSATSLGVQEESDVWEYSSGSSETGILHLSDEVLVQIFRQLDPTSLLRVGGACHSLFRVSSCNSLWTRHFQTSFGVQFATGTCSVTAKDSFRLLFMWKTLFRNLHCNRSLQEMLFAEVPFPPHRYWTQWLVLEERVPLPSVRLSAPDIQVLWGINKQVLDTHEEEGDEDDLLKFEWKTLHAMARERHGNKANLYAFVLNQQESNDHTELESMYHQYTQCRFQWLFSYWLFRQPPPFNRQLRAVFLQWRRYQRSKVATWGKAPGDACYLASLHPITADFWKGRLARGDEIAGIQSVENYFSMCRSLVAWILGRDWGRLKRRKVYDDTLAGVYLLLGRELQEGPVDHQRFWHLAKVQMARVCSLEETAVNYVNWRMIERLPYYKLYMVSGNPVYLGHVQNFLRRKRLVHDWIHQDQNTWVRSLLPDHLYALLEYDNKILQDSLHGDDMLARLSRVVWLFLNSGQHLYLDAVKGLVFQCAQAGLALYNGLLLPGLGEPVSALPQQQLS